MEKKDFLKVLAEVLTIVGKTMPLETLKDTLNKNGYRNNNGEEYTSDRGVAKLLSTTYKEMEQSGNHESAERIANSFTDKDGKYPWA